MATFVIADDPADARHALELTLRERGHAVHFADDGAAALALALKIEPDLVVLDTTSPRVQALQVAQELRSSATGARVPILFLTPDTDIPNARANFAARADDALAKPFTPTDLAARAEALLERGLGHFLAVAGPKGGCGRTTVSVNVALAIALARRDVAEAYLGGATLLVDGHFGQGDLDVHLDVRSNRSMLDLVEHAGRLDAHVVEQALVTHRSGLRVLRRPPGASESRSFPPALWLELMLVAPTIAETVVVDLGPGYDDQRTLATLRSASVVLLVVTPEIGSVRNARELMDAAARLRLDKSRLQPVLNRAQGDAHLDARAVATGLGVELASLIVLPDAGPSVVGQVNRGTPIVENRQSALGRALERMAGSLIGTPQG
ncbi:MAG: response regulator [Chloroflexota bacterium]